MTPQSISDLGTNVSGALSVTSGSREPASHVLTEKRTASLTFYLAYTDARIAVAKWVNNLSFERTEQRS